MIKIILPEKTATAVCLGRALMCIEITEDIKKTLETLEEYVIEKDFVGFLKELESLAASLQVKTNEAIEKIDLEDFIN